LNVSAGKPGKRILPEQDDPGVCGTVPVRIEEAEGRQLSFEVAMILFQNLRRDCKAQVIDAEYIGRQSID
jgi:hypothetical protein